jgi:hypothetical protein
MKSSTQVLGAALCLAFGLSLAAGAQTRRHSKDKKDEEARISILDSTDAQWGMRSVNASVYQGYPMNAVYLERGRTKLPDSFPSYKSGKLGNEIVVRSSSGPATPSTMRVNGVETPLPEGEE